MEITFIHEGPVVYEVRKYSDGTKQYIKIRTCNTAAEAKSVANYYRIRRV